MRENKTVDSAPGYRLGFESLSTDLFCVAFSSQRVTYQQDGQSNAVAQDTELYEISMLRADGVSEPVTAQCRPN